MRLYFLIFEGICISVLLSFGMIEMLQVKVLVDPTLEQYSAWGAGMLGVGLLVLDVFVPVPSSLIMISMGSIWGVPMGLCLSLIGSNGAAIVGFGLGRYGRSYLHAYISPMEQQRANRLFEQWGALAIVITRPVPILAEAMIIMAGTTSLSWSLMLLAATAGIFPVALLYALIGATAIQVNIGQVITGILVIVAGIAALKRLSH